MFQSIHRPLIMGIINLSRDSFYQSLPNYDDALKKSEQMCRDGADIIDIGAIATNPAINMSTQILTEQQELAVLIPLIEKLSHTLDVMISVDTYRARVMEAAIMAGAKMINDQRALTKKNALEMAVKLNVPVCLMHHFNPPRSPSVENCQPQELLQHIMRDLQSYVDRCLLAGMHRDCIILDPGFGGGHFGKSPAENFYILEQLHSIVKLGFPVLIGVSRKSMFGGRVEDRLSASVNAAIDAVKQGAAIIRVHDVKETADALFNIGD